MQLEQLAGKVIGIGFVGMTLTDEARALIARGVRNVILFTRNVESPEQLAQLTFDTKAATGSTAAKLMMSVDQEGGRVLRMREPFTLVPSMRQVGQAGDANLAYAVGRLLARELRAVNFDMNLAPVMDVDTNPSNPVISSRSFGATTQLVKKLGVAVIRGLQDGGVAACAKHFPGHGDTNKDSHHELPVLPNHDIARLEAIELPPFEAAVDAGVASVMTSHVIYQPIDAKFAATLSTKIIDGLLRKRLGFSGLVVSDDMQMKAIADHYGFDDAIVHAVNAGVDLIWLCHSVALQNRAIDLLIKAVEDGKLTRQRLEQASQRLDAVMAKFVKPPCEKPDLASIGNAEHQSVAEKIIRLAGEAVTSGEDPTEAFVREQTA